jgi:hypothetical protein
MKVLELFSGTGTLSKIARERGHETVTVDNDPKLNPDICADLRSVRSLELNYEPDMIWASPPCQAFSVAALPRHYWKKQNNKYYPLHDKAFESLALMDSLIETIRILNPKVWYIENPRGLMRKVIDFEQFPDFFARHTVTYCQYGEDRQKPTDIWTNNPLWIPRPACHKGDPCHEAAPRGAKTGTMKRRSPLIRAKLPEELCEEVLKGAEEYIEQAFGFEAGGGVV